MTDKLAHSKEIKCILFDVDGVLTDGKINYTIEGEIKSFNAKDGFGINLAIQVGLIIGIITARKSEIVRKRAEELGIKEIYIGQRNKKQSFVDIQKKYNLKQTEIAFMGDDLLDLPVLVACGLSAAPNDAVKDVKSVVDFISSKNGGNGAARDFIEYILKSQNKYNQVVGKLVKLEQS